MHHSTALLDEQDLKQLLSTLLALKRGDFTVRMPSDWCGLPGKVADVLNDIMEANAGLAEEIVEVSRVVGRDGRLSHRAVVPGASGSWGEMLRAVNALVDDLVRPTTEMARVIGAVAKGDLSQSTALDADGRPLKGQFLRAACTANTMVEQLSSFASEVTRVAREVGTEGKLGGQAHVPGVAGIWKDLTDNVNSMASNLTGQVRNIAEVTTAVARGDLSKKITVDVKGEILELKNTINVMVDQLNSFASEVTRVAREVGSEGKLGGQAQVEGAAGTWKDLTENLNRMAATLTTQVRAIADVATAVTRGDLSRSIQVEARGEVADLKDNINEMIRNLKETTQNNARQNWLKTNLARFTRLLQGQRDLETVSALILSELAPLVYAQHGLFYLMDAAEEDESLRVVAAYGCSEANEAARKFRPGQGLVGQCALEKQRIWLTNVPRDYIRISSGLGAAPPANIVVLPILFEQQVKAVIELASMERFTETHLSFLDKLMESIGVVLNTIEANSRTESLLIQSQSLAQELQQTNLELAEKASLLSAQNVEVERKNREVEQAKRALEEKASQLALSSKYKSEFLANISHELRTPLNSLLILAQQLADNREHNLSDAQVEYARTIYGSGSDLLTLINDILDLSKIESGTVSLEMSDYRFESLRTYVERTFRHMAEAKRIAFRVELDAALPRAMRTDTTRLQQILKNLLSNAFKFTSHGEVRLHIGVAGSGWTSTHPHLREARAVLAFSVIDTGVGIAPDKLQLIFEAFQQADGSTARKYGGTGLGLSISRELARLLHGEIRVRSTPGAGSEFTLYLPHDESLLQDAEPPAAAMPERRAVTEPMACPEDDTAQAMLDRLKRDPGTRHVPVHVLSEQEEEMARIQQFVSRDERHLLVVEHDPEQRRDLLTLIGAGVRIATASGAPDVLRLLRRHPFDCMVLGGLPPDSSPAQLLDDIAADPSLRHIPVVTYRPEAAGGAAPEQQRTGPLPVVKDARSPEQLFAETALFLHRTLESLPDQQRRMLDAASSAEVSLAGRKVLIVDDDLRNIFALSSLLESQHMRVLYAENGRDAIAALQADPSVDAVLMDIMMPGMDGYATMRAIRREPRFSALPIITLTAKAMQGDRDKCIGAGASDYIAKPVDARQLLSLLRIWIDGGARAYA